MSAFFELLADNASMAGRLVTTAAVVVLAFLVAMAARWLVGGALMTPIPATTCVRRSKSWSR